MLILVFRFLILLPLFTRDIPAKWDCCIVLHGPFVFPYLTWLSFFRVEMFSSEHSNLALHSLEPTKYLMIKLVK